MKNTGSEVSANGSRQSTKHQTLRAVIMTALLAATVGSLGISSAAQDAALPATTLAELAGPWQIALVGFTGCGQSALLLTGTLNSSGKAVGTLVGSSSGCTPSSSTTTQTFTITSLNANGTGTAGLTCGTSCGWGFNIQVSPNRQVMNLVDVVNNPGDVLAGTAVRQ